MEQNPSRNLHWFGVLKKNINKIYDTITRPHFSIQDIGERRTAQLQAALALVYALFNLIGLVASLSSRDFQSISAFTLGGLAILVLVGYIISRTAYYKIGAVLFVYSSIASAIPLIIGAVNEGRPISTGLFSVVPLGFAFGFVFLSIRGLVTLVILVTFCLPILPSFYPQISQEAFTDVGILSTLGVVLVITAVFRNSVERQRLTEAQTANQNLQELTESLEQRVDQRTRAIQTAAEVGRSLSTILEYNTLVKEVVEQLQKAFNYYHVHIYLYDDIHKRLVISGGTGEAAKIMLENEHSIPRGKGLVGRAYDSGKVILISDTSKDRDWLPNPLLPDTKSEIAVPISFGELVLGVLDVQQNLTDGLTQQDADLLQLIASQVGGALRNAQFYEQAQKQVQRELQLNAIIERIRATTSVDQALKVAVREISRTFNIPHAAVHLKQVSDMGEDSGS